MNFYLFIDLVVASLVTGGIYAVVALGLNLQYGLMRIMNIAHGEFLMLGAYLTYTLVRLTGASPLWFIPPMMVALFLLGLLLHRLIFRKLAATSASAEDMEARSLVVSFGLMFIAQNAAQLIWGGGMSGEPYLDQAVKFGEVTVAANRLLVLAVAAAASLALVLVLSGPCSARPCAACCRRRSAPCWSASTRAGCTRPASASAWPSLVWPAGC